MKGSFLIKASDLLTKDSTFKGAVVLKIDGNEYLEKGVLFLTPKGFNIRFSFSNFLEEEQVATVCLGNSFDNTSLKYYNNDDYEEVNSIFCFNFDFGDCSKKKANNFFTNFHYPEHNISYFYVSSLAKFEKNKINYSNLSQTSNIIKTFVFNSESIVSCLDKNFNWKLSLVSKTQLDKGLKKIEQALKETYKPNWVFYRPKQTVYHDYRIRFI